MANRLDYYYRQHVTELELDAGFDGLEQADRAIILDQGRHGVASGLGVTQQVVANMTALVGAGTAYSPSGERIVLPSNQSPNLAVDHLGVSTTVAGGGNEKWLSIFALFDRNLTDPRTDGGGATVYFSRAESFRFKVVQGAEAAAGLATRPALESNGVLLGDVKIAFGTTAVTNAMIDTTRRQDSIVVAGTPRSLRRGLVNDALGDVVSYYNAHVNGGADQHAAAHIQYAGGGSYLWGRTNPATSVEGQIDKIISDLAAVFPLASRRIADFAFVAAPAGASSSSNVFADWANYKVDFAATEAHDQLIVLATFVSSAASANGIRGRLRVIEDYAGTPTPVDVLDSEAIPNVAVTGGLTQSSVHVLGYYEINAGAPTRVQMRVATMSDGISASYAGPGQMVALLLR